MFDTNSWRRKFEFARRTRRDSLLHSSEDGFTLVEMLVSIFITTIILSSLYLLIVQSFTLWKKSEIRSDIQQTIQATIEEMSWDMRRATNNSKYPVIISDNPPAVRFYYVNTPTSYTFIRYRYSSADKKIYRESINAPTAKPTEAQWAGGTATWQNLGIVAEDVSAFTFSPNSYVFTGTATSARSFRINLDVEKSSKALTSTGKESTTVTTKVNLRNF